MCIVSDVRQASDIQDVPNSTLWYGRILMSITCGWGQGMDERAVATILGEVLAGVAYLHGRNIVHRDIKVSTILQRHA